MSHRAIASPLLSLLLTLLTIYDEIARLREGRPLILRATDIYNPLLEPMAGEGDRGCLPCLPGSP